MGIIGLDYTAVKSVCEALGADFDALLIRKIRVAETIELEKANKS